VGVSAGGRHLGCVSHAPFTEGVAKAVLAHLYMFPVRKQGGQRGWATGVPVARLEGQVRGKTTPSSWNTWVRHGGQAGVNRQAPWQGSEGNLGVRDRNHQGMGARSFQCRWQTSTECILALIERG
jgi:hypothetical protein